MPEPKTHAQNRPLVERILRHVPGFRGYLEKSYRRESDELQRKFLSDRLQRGKSGLEAYARHFADVGKIDELPACDRLRGQIDKIAARIGGAMQGYSGMFDLVRIDEALLDRVYEHDIALLDHVQKLAEGLEQLSTSTAPTSETLPPLANQITQLERSWDERTDILKGLE